jgi:hypothetical protein
MERGFNINENEQTKKNLLENRRSLVWLQSNVQFTLMLSLWCFHAEK